MTTVALHARVENYYVGSRSKVVTYPKAELPMPPGPMPQNGQAATPAVDAWLHEHLFGMTGTGRTVGDATYDLEVTHSSRPDLVPVGFSHAWGY